MTVSEWMVHKAIRVTRMTRKWWRNGYFALGFGVDLPHYELRRIDADCTIEKILDRSAISDPLMKDRSEELIVGGLEVGKDIYGVKPHCNQPCTIMGFI